MKDFIRNQKSLKPLYLRRPSYVMGERRRPRYTEALRVELHIIRCIMMTRAWKMNKVTNNWKSRIIWASMKTNSILSKLQLIFYSPPHSTKDLSRKKKKKKRAIGQNTTSIILENFGIGPFSTERRIWCKKRLFNVWTIIKQYINSIFSARLIWSNVCIYRCFKKKVGHISITWKNSLSLRDVFQIILGQKCYKKKL